MTGKGLNSAAGKGKKPGDRARRHEDRPKKPADPAYLERAALYYLERFATTRGHLALVMRRKIRRRGLAEGVTDTEAEQWIATLVDKMVRLGFVDDMTFAQSRAQSLLARGKPMRAIRYGLAEKSVPQDMIDQVLEDLAGSAGDTDLLAAIRYVRRRRIGPARLDPSGDAEARRKAHQRDMAALARTGFSFDVAKKVLAVEGASGLDALELAASG